VRRKSKRQRLVSDIVPRAEGTAVNGVNEKDVVSPPTAEITAEVAPSGAGHGAEASQKIHVLFAPAISRNQVHEHLAAGIIEPAYPIDVQSCGPPLRNPIEREELA
jgi:hypothetical protein